MSAPVRTISARKGARRHHNNKGLRQIKRGKTAKSLEAICRKIGLPFRHGPKVKP